MLFGERTRTVKWKRSDITTRTVLAVFELGLEERGDAADFIVRLRGCPRKVANLAIQREYAKGYVDSDGVLVHGYLTNKGKAELDRLCGD